MLKKPIFERNVRTRDNLSDAASSARRNIAEGFGRRELEVPEPQLFLQCVHQIVALGGTPARVLRTVVGNAMAISFVGLAIGGLAAPTFSRLLGRTLYGVESADPRILAAAIALLAAVSIAACALPARRVVRADPGAALRQE